MVRLRFCIFVGFFHPEIAGRSSAKPLKSRHLAIPASDCRRSLFALARQRPKAPLCKGWCSAQRIKIIIVASGNDTLIHLLAKISDFCLEDCAVESCDFAGSKANTIHFTASIPPSRHSAAHLPLHKGGSGAVRVFPFFDKLKPASCDTGFLCGMFSYACQALHTSTQAVNPENFSISGIVSSMAELLLPAAGKTVSNRWMEMSR